MKEMAVMKIKNKFHRISVFIFTYPLILISLVCLSINAQAATGVGKYGASFLQIKSGARQVAMGQAFTALAYDDINLMRYNIGGLGSIRNIMLGVNYHNWIDDTYQGGFGVALPTRFGVVGFDFNYFNEGDLVELDNSFNRTGTIYESNDLVFTIGYGTYLKALNKKLLFGGGLKIVRQNLVQESATAAGMDLGMLLWLKHITFGITMQNFSITKLKFINEEESLPETYRAGIGGKFEIGDHIRWNLDFDLAYLPGQDLRYYSGTEVIINELVMLRGGYKIHEFATNRWAAGMGLLIPMSWLANSETRLDYSYTPLDAFESSTHRFSLLFRFGVLIPGVASYPDERKLARLNEQLKKELEAAEKALLAAEEAELRMLALEDTMRARLARIKKIASESHGKIEVVEEVDAAPGEIQDTILVRVNFDFDKTNVRPEDFETMDRVADILNTYPESRVFIAGHADFIGTHEYNFNLSQKRVNSVTDFLTTNGNVNYDRFFNPIGYGKLKPIADNTTELGRFRNRRVDFVIYTRNAQPILPEGSAILSVKAIDNATIHIVGNGRLQFDYQIITDPYRLVIDFPHTFLYSEIRTYEIFRGPFIRSRLGYHPDEIFSRVVIDLFDPILFDIEAVENLVIIRLK